MIKSKRTKPRPGRLQGSDLDNLRMSCYERDEGLCQRCGKRTMFGVMHYHADSFHMAHIKAKRMGGDSIDNVQTECGNCHIQYHERGPSMEKPVPAKSREAINDATND